VILTITWNYCKRFFLHFHLFLFLFSQASFLLCRTTTNISRFLTLHSERKYQNFEQKYENSERRKYENFERQKYENFERQKYENFVRRRCECEKEMK
jgi:hypothetical protein